MKVAWPKATATTRKTKSAVLIARRMRVGSVDKSQAIPCAAKTPRPDLEGTETEASRMHEGVLSRRGIVLQRCLPRAPQPLGQGNGRCEPERLLDPRQVGE